MQITVQLFSIINICTSADLRIIIGIHFLCRSSHMRHRTVLMCYGTERYILNLAFVER